MTFLLISFGNADEKPAQPAAGTKTIKDVVKSSKKYDGLFTLYQDTTTGATHILIKNDQFDKEYIYFSLTVDGVIDASQFRGAYGANTVFSIRKYFNRLEFVEENTSYYFDKQSALSRSADANISRSVFHSQTIVAQDSAKNEYLIKGDDLFLTESLRQIKPSSNPEAKPGTTFSLGTLSKEKCKILQIKNYPANTDVTVEYVYDNPSPVVRGGPDITDARFVSIKVQHSLIEVPQNDFQLRFDDPRVGYFTQEVTNMTSSSATNYRDVINRWHLKKKDKNAPLSEPVEPIVWWIENTTPIELRPTIEAATLAWNVAFEMAGFRNAIQVKIQPDTAEWDAGDIRYNVLRWTSSPKPPFGGYGPSFVNPRTGQILGADIMLEYVAITNRLRHEELFDAAALDLQSSNQPTDPKLCTHGTFSHNQALFGLQVLGAVGVSDVERREYVKEYIYELILHELGHTFGLNHNMKASQYRSPVQVNNRELTSGTGLMASVMDYSTPNVSLDKKTQGQYFTTIPGPYDRWAIEYGYSEALNDETAEKARMTNILSRSTEPALMFGNDADDMRSPGKAIDPRVMVGDMTNDAITYETDRLKLANAIFGKLKTKYSKPGQSYHELRNAYLILTGQGNTAVGVISRYIGGVYVDRGFIGQEGATKPFTPVSKADQKRAMATLKTYLFAPDAFKTPSDLYNYLQQQRRGFGFFTATEDPKLHSRVLNIQKGVLDHLMSPVVLTRITDSRLYGNEYSLTEVMDDLTNAIFKDDAKGNVNTFRQNLQLEYVNRLTAMMDEKSKYDNPSQSMAIYHLRSIRRMVAAKKGVNTETLAHTENLLLTIDRALEVKR